MLQRSRAPDRAQAVARDDGVERIRRLTRRAGLAGVALAGVFTAVFFHPLPAVRAPSNTPPATVSGSGGEQGNGSGATDQGGLQPPVQPPAQGSGSAPVVTSGGS